MLVCVCVRERDSILNGSKLSISTYLQSYTHRWLPLRKLSQGMTQCGLALGSGTVRHPQRGKQMSSLGIALHAADLGEWSGSQPEPPELQK